MGKAVFYSTIFTGHCWVDYTRLLSKVVTWDFNIFFHLLQKRLKMYFYSRVGEFYSEVASKLYSSFRVEKLVGYYSIFEGFFYSKNWVGEVYSTLE